MSRTLPFENNHVVLYDEVKVDKEKEKSKHKNYTHKMTP
jgi:arylamine N-acetyltransferase